MPGLWLPVIRVSWRSDLPQQLQSTSRRQRPPLYEQTERPAADFGPALPFHFDLLQERFPTEASCVALQATMGRGLPSPGYRTAQRSTPVILFSTWTGSARFLAKFSWGLLHPLSGDRLVLNCWRRSLELSSCSSKSLFQMQLLLQNLQQSPLTGRQGEEMGPQHTAPKRAGHLPAQTRGWLC